MEVTEHKFYRNTSSKGPNGYCAKPSTAADETTEFLSGYNAQGSPLANFQIHDATSKVCKGAPSAAIYDDKKSEANQEIVMACHAETSTVLVTISRMVCWAA